MFAFAIRSVTAILMKAFAILNVSAIVIFVTLNAVTTRTSASVVTPNAVATNRIANIDANELHLELCFVRRHVVHAQNTGRIPNPKTGPALPLASHSPLVADEPLIIHKLINIIPSCG